MALMKHKGLFELLEKNGKYLLDTKFQSRNGLACHGDAALTTTRLAIQTMLEELAPNLWEDDLDRLVDYGHVISPELEMVHKFESLALITTHLLHIIYYIL